MGEQTKVSYTHAVPMHVKLIVQEIEQTYGMKFLTSIRTVCMNLSKFHEIDFLITA